MRRKLVMALLLLGAIVGFASGIASIGRFKACHRAKREALMESFAQKCVEAARTEQKNKP